MALRLAFSLMCTAHTLISAQTVEQLDASKPTPSPVIIPAMGENDNPAGFTITCDSTSFKLSSVRTLPVSGEFHFARAPVTEWRTSLLAMKAGGITQVNTYVFWIHHNEIQSTWDWSGNKNLSAFVATAGSVGLTVLIRAGPWAHGECRNGGHPDWLVKEPGIKLRSTQPQYMAHVAVLYTQIAAQLTGLLWKDFGPVVALQVDNEFGGSYTYLEALKTLAQSVGLDVPYYVKTGWPSEPQPFPLLLNMEGRYADGFWDRELHPVASYNDGYLFRSVVDANTAPYPILGVEYGGGMPASYHRRIKMEPTDMVALATTMLGCGAVQLGYYMYRGGTNPRGTLSTLQESQISGMSNDMPIFSYDFFAPIGEFGQVHPHYHGLRMLNLAVAAWGDALAAMPPYWPVTRPSSNEDNTTLRWAVRSKGVTGFVFINNYQRNTVLSQKGPLRLNISLAGGASLLIPSASSPPLVIQSGVFAVLPFNFGFGGGIRAIYATAQAITALGGVGGEGDATVVFSAVDGIAPEFVFDDSGATKIVVLSCSGTCTSTGGVLTATSLSTGTGLSFSLRGPSGVLSVVLVTASDGHRVWRADAFAQYGLPALMLSDADGVLVDNKGATLRVRVTSGPTDATSTASFAITPAPSNLTLMNGVVVPGTPNGVFTSYAVPVPAVQQVSVSALALAPAGPPRTVPIGSAGVAQAPDEDGGETEWAAAATFLLTFSKGPGGGGEYPPSLGDYDFRLAVNYTADCARLYVNSSTSGEWLLVEDNWYNGVPMEASLNRFGDRLFGPAAAGGGFLLKLLPLSKGAPIFLNVGFPDFGPNESVLRLNSVRVVQTWDVAFAVV